MSVLQTARVGAVTRLVLDRPRAGNALDLELASALEAAVDEARNDGTRVILLTGRGPLFCGGGDVAAIAAAANPERYTRELADTVHRALLAIAESGIALVASVHGPAAGAGFAMVLNADYVVAAERASFLTAYAGIGVSPDGGTTYLLPRIVGLTRATELTLAGRRLDAATAREWGIANEVTTSEKVDAAGLKAAERLARLPAQALTESKRLLAASWLPGYRAHLEDEAATIARLMGTDDARALRAAFLERSRG